jgi:hypothetical protein
MSLITLIATDIELPILDICKKSSIADSGGYGDADYWFLFHYIGSNVQQEITSFF